MPLRQMFFAVFSSLIITVCFAAGSVAQEADNPGLETLDKATDLKLSANLSLEDLKKVISLCEQAKKEGLVGDNLDYCDQLLASSQLQVGTVMAQLLLETPPNRLPENWKDIRHSTLEYLELAVKILKDQPQPYFLIAQLNRLPEGNLDRSKAAMDSAVEKAKDDKPLLAKLLTAKAIYEEDKEKRSKLLEEALAADPDSIETIITAGANFADLGDFDKATELLKKAVDKEPKSATALGILTNIYVKQKKFDEALKILDLVGEIMPDSVEPLIEKARVLAQMEKNDEAIALLDAARAKDSNNPMVLLVRASLYLDKKKYDEAIKDLDAVLRLVPGIDIALFLKIQILTIQEKYTEALDLLKEMKDSKGESPEILLEMGQVYSLKKEPKKAIELIDAALKLQLEKAPDDKDRLFRIYRLQADTLLALGQHSSSVKSYEEALKINPDDPVLLNNFAWILATSPIDIVRNGKKALELAMKASEKVEHKEAFILSTVAAAHAEQGDFKSAIEWAEKSVAAAKEAKAEDEYEKKKNAEQLEHLQKELESYKRGEPWRELGDETP